MAEEFDLHPLAVEDARNGHQRPKIEEYGDSLFAVLHTVEPVAETARRRAASSAKSTSSSGPTTCCRCAIGRKQGFADVRARTRARARAAEARRGLRALRADGQRRRPLFSDPRRARDRARADRGADLRQRNAARSNIEALYALKRKLMALKHAVDPLMEAAGKLYGGRVPQICAGMQRILPRRLRPSAPDPRVRSKASAKC